ncbi:AAA family ATPase [Thiohalomonas denitrificans]|uniref:Predicted ATP-dependent endonuclease of the OLD family, contains P-loop ATPase and TOPRIM domains n=1 Tax=Thiohalomonas denitrificans TaxID=415747 RepID=A0A1G5R3D8_9GAMM|nr:AAA family ATPase [Thiohalomonas denitrificans]SCZ68456.1 Predicted ATP-dependent endonuclease of the OLD family, contains P-loop ATPase and TOPRIM domains [Thiohalomonas denitrificans]
MRLHRLHVEGLRRLQSVDVEFGDATFCIGPNNSGKSSVLIAIEYLLSGNKRIPEADYYSEIDAETGEKKVLSDCVVLEAEFRNVPTESDEWRGFKGRTFTYEVPVGSDETGISIYYRKSYPLGKDVVVELKSKERKLAAQFEGCKSPQDFIDAGASEELFEELFGDLAKNIAAKDKIKLQAVDEIWELSDQEEWFQNPGGIPGNVLSRLPRFLKIPAEAASYEIDDPKKGVLGKTLNELFEDVRDQSDNYKEAQKHLDELTKELDPSDENSEFGKMMIELNKVLSSVFPDSALHATADLSDPKKALVPSFEIAMSSNIQTPVSHQGTGMVRSAVFGMLRFRQKWLSTREDKSERSLIIGFEEPEIYLHPSAANQMRDTIYELSGVNSQIVATTHSPFLIDLSRKPRQVLNRFRCEDVFTESAAFNVSDEFVALNDEDKDYVKMLLRIDDYVARAFFTKMVVLVEGDTEDIVLREALKRLPAELRNKISSDFEVIKARGKASIIGIARYFHALSINFRVMHDRDAGVAGAEKFNQPIQEAVGDPDRIVVLEECLEDVLGYPPPSSEKPFVAYKGASAWGESWKDVPENLRLIMERLFDGYVKAE